MIKLICFVKRNSALSVDEFHRHWREQHGPLIARTPEIARHVLRYEQNHRVRRDYERGDDFDGVAIQWYESPAAFAAMVEDPAYMGRIRPDEEFMLDLEQTIWILTHDEDVIIPGPERGEGPMTKLICLVKRNPSLSVEQFHKQWLEVHGPLNRETPGIARHFIRYEQNHRTMEDYQREPSPDFDGAAVEWFTSPREFFDMIAEPDYERVIAPHESEFLDMPNLVWMLSDNEEVVIG